MTRTLISITLALLLATAPAWCQAEPSDARATFESARLAMDGEGDPARAARLFADAARLATEDAAFAATAWLRCAMAERALGRVDAARAALQHAAAGEGPDAAMARRALEEAAPQEAVPQEARVEAALLGLRQGDKATQDRAAMTIQRIGRRAVPVLVRALKVDDADLAFVSRAAALLARIGGPEAVAWFRGLAKSEDVLLRTVAVDGLGTLGRAEIGAEILDALRALRDDPAPEVRERVLAIRGDEEALEVVLAALTDPASGVRRVASNVVSRRIHRLGADDEDGARRIAGKLVGLLDAEDREVAANAGRLIRWPLLQRPAALRIFLERLGRDPGALRALEVPMHFNLLDHDRPPETPWPELLAAARTAASAESPPRLKDVVGQLARALFGAWDGDDLEPAIALVATGVAPGEVQQWVVHNVRSAQLPALAGALPGFGAPEAVANEIEKAGIDEATAAAARRTLREWLADGLPLGAEAMKTATALLRVGFRAADASTVQELLDLLLREDALVPPLLEVVTRRRDGAARGACLRIVVLDSDHPHAATWRNRAFGHLAMLGDQRLAPLVREAYVRGMAVDGDRQGGRRGLVWYFIPLQERLALAEMARHQRGGQFALALNDRDGRVLAIDDLELRNALVRVLGSDDGDALAAAWADVAALLQHRGGWGQRVMTTTVGSGSLAFYRDAAYEVFASLVLDRAPGELRDEIVEGLLEVSQPLEESRRLRHDLWLRCLRSDDPALQAIAVRAGAAIPDPEAIPLLAKLLDRAEFDALRLLLVRILAGIESPRVLPVLEPLLRDASPVVRASAADALVELDPEHAFDHVGPLLDDEDATVRREAARLSGEILTPEAVPGLLRLLRDPSKNVKSAARKALESLREYVESRRLWEQLTNKGGLDAPSAADALLRQAAEGQPRAVRIAALRSLGTLGQPETLPFLIEFLRTEDAELRAAATASIERINAKED